MFFFGVSVLAGILTVLAPCILPLLPVVVGSSEPGTHRISARALRVIGSLVVSVIVFTLLLKATTLFIAIPTYAWAWFSGVVLIFLGISMAFPDLWAKIPLVQRIAQSGSKTLGSGYSRSDSTGDLLMGFALGPVFSTCSPTYLFIIATVLPASFLVGLLYLFGFALGLAFALLLIAYFGQRIINLIISRMDATKVMKRVFGILIIVVGLMIATGLDKKLESKILDSGYGATINFEVGLIERFGIQGEESQLTEPISEAQKIIMRELPETLINAFPETDWTRLDPRLAEALSGGPSKDGIPALDSPTFVPLESFTLSDAVEAIVLRDGSEVKVYPYNILIWHEIVNDRIGDTPVAVTFCPLCGSAIVYERNIHGDETTLGVSGHLLESNMIMYDRKTESLWQQSTGEALAGKQFGTTLTIFPMQLMTIGEVRKYFPRARVLSDNTGYQRDYTRNPYAGYEKSNEFYFPVTVQNITLHSKTITVVFNSGDRVGVIPWSLIKEDRAYPVTLNEKAYTLHKKSGELTITGQDGEKVPFYFEMWFSVFAQHGDTVEVLLDNDLIL